VDLQKCKECGIAVTNTPDVLTDDTADLAIALLLASMRHVCAADRFVRKGCWPKLREYPLTYKVCYCCCQFWLFRVSNRVSLVSSLLSPLVSSNLTRCSHPGGLVVGIFR
jgi:hypothetical protein